MALTEYRRKRDFKTTPEPQGKPGRNAGRLSFVVQRHHASRLHYDFRLEMEGVLRSWAVPKGPSLDPKERRLAVETEDHPLEYGSFEGEIPAGEYGGGQVILWDRGHWIPDGDPVRAYHAGKLGFSLEGEKLRGRWTLVLMRSREGRESGKKNWLLLKERDAEANPDFDIVNELPESVHKVRRKRAGTGASAGRGAAKGAARAAAPRPAKTSVAPDPSGLPGARKRPLTEEPQAELATLVDRPPSGDAWLHETKFDGYRILARLERGKARLISRNGHDWTARYSGVAEAVEALPASSALLDGEVVALGPDGRSSFQKLQRAMSGGGRVLVYFVFDLLYLDGCDLTGAPLETRKEALERLVSGGDASAVRYSGHVVGREKRSLPKPAASVGKASSPSAAPPPIARGAGGTG